MKYSRFERKQKQKQFECQPQIKFHLENIPISYHRCHGNLHQTVRLESEQLNTKKKKKKPSKNVSVESEFRL